MCFSLVYFAMLVQWLVIEKLQSVISRINCAALLNIALFEFMGFC